LRVFAGRRLAGWRCRGQFKVIDAAEQLETAANGFREVDVPTSWAADRFGQDVRGKVATAMTAL
jgi:hypothetical protein